METLSCHSDKCTWANAIKKHSFCRGTYYVNFCNVSASSPIWLLRRWFFNIFRKFNILVAMATNPLNQSNSAVWKKFIYMLGRGLLKEHFCKTFIKYICSETTINANFHISHYMSMIAIRVLIRLEQKNFFFFVPPAYRCYIWNLVRIRSIASVEMSFENVDGRTDDGHLPIL